MSGIPIIHLIDGIVAAVKSIEGTPHWEDVGHAGEFRLVAPLYIDGVSTGVVLEINSYPNIQELRFRIMLRQKKCFARIDYVNDEQHLNPFGLGDDFPKAMFCGPHIHNWKDNRVYCTTYELPNKLNVARLLPGHIRQFDGILRWFCGEYNIAQPPTGLISLPSRTRLL